MNAARDVLQERVRVDVILVEVVQVNALRVQVTPSTVGVLGPTL